MTASRVCVELESHLFYLGFPRAFSLEMWNIQFHASACKIEMSSVELGGLVNRNENQTTTPNLVAFHDCNSKCPNHRKGRHER